MHNLQFIEIKKFNLKIIRELIIRVNNEDRKIFLSKTQNMQGASINNKVDELKSYTDEVKMMETCGTD